MRYVEPKRFARIIIMLPFAILWMGRISCSFKPILPFLPHVKVRPWDQSVFPRHCCGAVSNGYSMVSVIQRYMTASIDENRHDDNIMSRRPLATSSLENENIPNATYDDSPTTLLFSRVVDVGNTTQSKTLDNNSSVQMTNHSPGPYNVSSLMYFPSTKSLGPFGNMSLAFPTINISTLGGGKYVANANISNISFFAPLRNMYFAGVQRIKNVTREAEQNLRTFWNERSVLEDLDSKERLARLDELFQRVKIDAKRPKGKGFLERTLMGLIHALADEVEDLDVEVDTQPGTPFRKRKINQLQIHFSRLGFEAIRLGGSDKYDNDTGSTRSNRNGTDVGLALVASADEAFGRIDKDGNGALDKDEVAAAMEGISDLETDKASLAEFATNLIDLYDVNHDGVMDRKEYQHLIDDMAKLRPAPVHLEGNSTKGPLSKVKESVQSISREISARAAHVAAMAGGAKSPQLDPHEREMGTITISNLHLDLRRLVAGSIPIIKRITSGGPLFLEPFTTTIKGSFTNDDIVNSFQVQSGLRFMVSRAIHVRLSFFRDIMDGAYFFGRQWNMASKSAPIVHVRRFSNVEFATNQMILTGRARIRMKPETPLVTNTFKVRTRIGTLNDGHTICLVEPELAVEISCPKCVQEVVTKVYDFLGLPPPSCPEPWYPFFPIYSRLAVNETSGFSIGPDNQLQHIFIKDGKLRFELRSVLRPAVFLGNQCIAFTLPHRRFILTTDRLMEILQTARKQRRDMAAALQQQQQQIQQHQTLRLQDQEQNATISELATLSTGENSTTFPVSQWYQTTKSRLASAWKSSISSLVSTANGNPKSDKGFLARFVDGYMLVEREGAAMNERLTNEISHWFGRQGNGPSSMDSSSSSNKSHCHGNGTRGHQNNGVFSTQ